MVTTSGAMFPRRVYPLSLRNLTEEQLAVVFAMTSRRPEAFDEIAKQVNVEKSADFHERWVLGYGHASVAEHAIIHMAVENISRLACDVLEDNRLASYTEKSSRFQVLADGYYHLPSEVENSEKARTIYVDTCNYLFTAYSEMMDKLLRFLESVRSKENDETGPAYNLRLKREAIDSCRFLLPTATLTNVGVTMNARVLEHAIVKLLSGELEEERELGETLKTKSKQITPTLIKYADQNKYLVSVRKRLGDYVTGFDINPAIPSNGDIMPNVDASLVNYTVDAEERLTAALIYGASSTSYEDVWQAIQQMTTEERRKIISFCLDMLGPHDSTVRELEMIDYTFEFTMDYGAYREFKRHRMQSYISQSVTVKNGYVTPPLVIQAGLEGFFVKAMERSEKAFRVVEEVSPQAAQYIVTHAHKRRVLSKMNLRECYHLFKMRTQPQAHFSIRTPMDNALKLAVNIHPFLFKHLRLREYPSWWPFEVKDRL